MKAYAVLTAMSIIVIIMRHCGMRTRTSSAEASSIKLLRGERACRWPGRTECRECAKGLAVLVLKVAVVVAVVAVVAVVVVVVVVVAGGVAKRAVTRNGQRLAAGGLPQLAIDAAPIFPLELQVAVGGPSEMKQLVLVGRKKLQDWRRAPACNRCSSSLSITGQLAIDAMSP